MHDDKPSSSLGGASRRPGPARAPLHALRSGLRRLLSREAGWALLAALAVALAHLLWTRSQADETDTTQRERLRLATSLAASVLQADLGRSLAAADTLDGLLRASGRIDRLDEVADSLRERFPLLGTVVLAPGGVVRQVSPASLAPALAGQALQDAPVARAAVAQALRSRQMAVVIEPAGAGRMVLNGYQPVFRRAPGDSGAGGGSAALWGWVMVSVRVPELAPYLDAARLPAASVRAELTYQDPQSLERLTLGPPALAGEAPVASAELRLSGQRLVLQVAPRQPWLGGVLAPLWSVLAGLVAGGLCLAWLQRQRRLAMRRRFFETSQILAGWSTEFDAAHACLDDLRHRAGMAVVVAVRMPATGTFQRHGAPVAKRELRDWSRLIAGGKRNDDLLLHLHGQDYLLAAHDLPSRQVADRVRRRLHTLLQEVTVLACGPEATPLFLQSVVFEPAAQDPGSVLARLLVALHAQDGPVVPRRATTAEPAVRAVPAPPTQPASLG